MTILDRIAMIAETKHLIVNVYGVDGNALCIIGACQSAMKKARVPAHIIDAFFTEATSGDYNNVLKTCDLWVKIIHVAPVERHNSAIGAFREAGLDPEVQW